MRNSLLLFGGKTTSGGWPWRSATVLPIVLPGHHGDADAVREDHRVHVKVLSRAKVQFAFEHIPTHCLTDQDPLFLHPGEWVDCGAPDDPQCIVSQWNPVTGEPTAWGRWVFDYRLQPGSPAIDAGASEGAPTTDIEGHGRPCGNGVDIGAYELGDCAASRWWWERWYPESLPGGGGENAVLYYRAAAIVIAEIRRLNPELSLATLAPGREIRLPTEM